MTTHLIRQRTGSDCVLACIAMAAGLKCWSDVWRHEDADEVVKSKGVSCFDYDKWGERVGLKFDYISVYRGSDQELVKFMLQGWPAILSVNSLNVDGGSHAVFWDGQRLYDPQDGVEGKLSFKLLHSVYITGVHRVRAINGGWPEIDSQFLHELTT